MHRESTWFVLAALAITGLGALFDLKTRRVPNVLTLPPLVAAPALHALVAYQSQVRGVFGISGPALEALLSIVGAAACALVPYVMFRFGLMGGGDGKLLASVGALLAARLGVEAELLALLFAGYVGLARLAFRGRLFPTLGNGLASLAGAVAPALRPADAPTALFETLPFAPFVFLGTLVAPLLHPLR
jgi:prepilin peptidase CpaA